MQIVHNSWAWCRWKQSLLDKARISVWITKARAWSAEHLFVLCVALQKFRTLRNYEYLRNCNYHVIINFSFNQLSRSRHFKVSCHYAKLKTPSYAKSWFSLGEITCLRGHPIYGPCRAMSVSMTRLKMSKKKPKKVKATNQMRRFAY